MFTKSLEICTLVKTNALAMLVVHSLRAPLLPDSSPLPPAPRMRAGAGARSAAPLLLANGNADTY